MRTIIVLVLLNLLSIGFFLWKGNGHAGDPELFPSNDYRDVSGILKRIKIIGRAGVEN